MNSGCREAAKVMSLDSSRRYPYTQKPRPGKKQTNSRQCEALKGLWSNRVERFRTSYSSKASRGAFDVILKRVYRALSRMSCLGCFSYRKRDPVSSVYYPTKQFEKGPILHACKARVLFCEVRFLKAFQQAGIWKR